MGGKIMNILFNLRYNYLFAKVKGDLDMHTVPKFKEKIISALKEKNSNNLVLNLKGVDFIDSTGLGAILGRYRNLADQEGKLILAGLKPQVKRILELSGVLELVPVYKSEKEIIDNLKEGNNIA